MAGTRRGSAEQVPSTSRTARTPLAPSGLSSATVCAEHCSRRRSSVADSRHADRPAAVLARAGPRRDDRADQADRPCHLAADGPNLSLRAVARDLGVVSSAVYRYFASRDELLTALIVDGYIAMAEAIEQAEAAVARRDLVGRWIALGRAARAWSLAQPARVRAALRQPGARILGAAGHDRARLEAGRGGHGDPARRRGARQRSGTGRPAAAGGPRRRGTGRPRSWASTAVPATLVARGLSFLGVVVRDDQFRAVRPADQRRHRLRRLLRAPAPGHGPAPGARLTSSGICDPAFAAVREVFDAEPGRAAAISARPWRCTSTADAVVDLWGGIADERTGRPWQRDTACVTFSATKAVTATAALLLAERGAVALDARVTEWWPEFGRARQGDDDRRAPAQPSGRPARLRPARHGGRGGRPGGDGRPPRRPAPGVAAGHRSRLPRDHVRLAGRRTRPAALRSDGR